MLLLTLASSTDVFISLEDSVHFFISAFPEKSSLTPFFLLIHIYIYTAYISVQNINENPYESFQDVNKVHI